MIQTLGTKEKALHMLLMYRNVDTENGRKKAMHDYILLFGSLTYAMKAKRLLEREGVTCKLQRISERESKGCDYGIHIEEGRLLHATMLLREALIPYRMQT